MRSESYDVGRFNARIGEVTNSRPILLAKSYLRRRIECMKEELKEFEDAVEKGDLPEQADALVDLVYFAKGTAVAMGLPWSELWDDVHRANMEKIPGATERSPVDAIKPPGWHPPNTRELLVKAGWEDSQ